MELEMLRSWIEAGIWNKSPESEVIWRPGESECENFMEPFEYARIPAWALVFEDRKSMAVSESE